MDDVAAGPLVPEDQRPTRGHVWAVNLEGQDPCVLGYSHPDILGGKVHIRGAFFARIPAHFRKQGDDEGADAVASVEFGGGILELEESRGVWGEKGHKPLFVEVVERVDEGVENGDGGGVVGGDSICLGKLGMSA